jgi:hypothetical protein
LGQTFMRAPSWGVLVVAGGEKERGGYGCVVHGDVVDVDVLYDVEFAYVLAEGTDADSVGAVAKEVLDEYVCAIRFERYAV